MSFNFNTHGVCPSQISFELDDDIVKNVVFTGGCNGNLKAISKVVEGMTVDKVETFFRGIHCGRKSSSCTDQLAIAVKEAYEKSKQSA